MDNRATRRVVRVAQELAASHGHTWGSFGLPDQETFSIAEISALLIEPNPLGMDGITAPRIEADGSIRHWTATGRLTWTVGELPLSEMHITLEFERPDGCYAVAELYAAGEDTPANLYVVVPDDAPVYHERHVRIVLEAVVDAGRALEAALGGPESPWAEWVAQAAELQGQVVPEREYLEGEIQHLQGQLDRLLYSPLPSVR